MTRTGPGYLLAASLALLAAGGTAAQIPDEFTNLKVLPEDISKPELLDLMKSFCGALDVRCHYCHVGEEDAGLETYDFAADEKKAKESARLMLRMTREINQAYLSRLEERKDPVEVRCATCHRGQVHPRLIQDVLAKALAMGGAEAAVRTYRELRAEHYGSHTYDFSEAALNNLAFDLARERPDDALLLMEVNAEYFPDSPVVHHLLGEIQAVRGETAAATGHLEHALALDPQNPRARQLLDKLRGEAAPPE